MTLLFSFSPALEMPPPATEYLIDHPRLFNCQALFKKKIEEDGGNTDLSRYRVNLGRSSDEIKDMKSRIEDELFGVLTVDERKNFDLDKALKRINKAMENVT